MRLITALDVAMRDGQPTVREWIRVTSIQMKMKGFTPIIFDGAIAGHPVLALVSNGRWVALCDVPNCDGCEYVDPQEPIFFCMKCGNNSTGKARPVNFPKEFKEIDAALLERDMLPVVGGDLVNQAFNARPVHPDLRRDWAPKELEGHPSLERRVVVDAYGETPAMIRRKTEEIRHARDV